MKQRPVRYRGVSKKGLDARSEASVADREARKLADITEPAEIRTNIVLEETLVMEAQAITGIKTKTGVVHHALREVVRRAKQKEMLALRGKVAWEGDLDEMRRSR